MLRTIVLFAFLIFLAGGCSDKNDLQISKPVIQMDGADAFPKNCVTVYRGESFEFKAVFTDEEELGSFNLEIHNNFDHHSHSTDDVECELGEKKAPVKPFIYNKDFTIPTGQISYTASVKVDIPEDIDTGDYHFMVRLTNKAAWQEIKGISLKIGERKE